MANRKINLTELDFDTIKSNIKDFLKNQSTFSDYDFEGAGLSVLLDILAYNTHYNAIYNNLSINEMFLDSARKRNSVVSLAKMLGYTPKSATSATAMVNITVGSSTLSPDIIVLPVNTPFTTNIDGVSYNFYNRASYTATKNLTSGYYQFTDVTLTEGVPLTFNYTVANGVQYIIPNTNVDVSTLVVKVFESVNSSNVTIYSKASSIVNVQSTSTVYWVKEIDDGLYEIDFGDDIIGKSVSNGNVVQLSYMVSSLDAANGARVFTYAGNPLFSSSPTPSVTATSSAASGAASEELDSIRFNAPRSYSAQNRAVTVEDYKALIYENLPGAHSVAIWGGEDNTPPIYGKLFICVKPDGAEILTTQQKDYILNSILTPRNVVTITPVIVDADYINISMDVTIYYNELETSRSNSDIATVVTDAIVNYNDTDLQKFDGIFRYSKLSKIIDTSENSIINNISTITLHRVITPKYGIIAQYVINLITPIYYSGVPEDIIISTGFYIYGDSTNVYYLVDDGIGNIQLFYYDGDKRIITNYYIGTVNYSAGTITVSNLNITSIVGDSLELSIKPQSNDVVSAYTQIVQIDSSRLTVTAISDKTINSNTAGGTNYVFTSSRT